MRESSSYIIRVQQSGCTQKGDSNKVYPPTLYAEQGEEECAGDYQQGFTGAYFLFHLSFHFKGPAGLESFHQISYEGC